MRFSTTLDTPLGPVFAEATEKGVCALRFGSEPATPGNDHPHLEELRRQMEEYWSGARREFDLPLDLGGTEFELRVWQALLRVPFGQTRSYAEIARAVGAPKAFRAVGRAVGLNPVWLVIPCHRIVASDGGLGGYAGGLERKRKLLEHEGHGLGFCREIPRLFAVR